MIRDGTEPCVPYRLKQAGWRCISTAPIATPNLIDLDAGIDVTVEPVDIEGLTATGLRIRVTYWARGDYEDRWVSSRTGRTITNLTHWRPVAGP